MIIILKKIQYLGHFWSIWQLSQARISVDDYWEFFHKKKLSYILFSCHQVEKTCLQVYS